MNELDFSEITKLNERYSKDPKSRIFVQLADLYRKNNMIDEALDVLNKGFEYHPEYPVAYLILGKCYYDKRSYTQARDAFEKTILFDPQNIVALRMLAKTCEVLKDERGQINAYKSIIAIDPMDTNAKEKLSMLEALQRKEPMYTVAMAEEYEKQGNHEEALQIYEHLLYTDPSDLILNQKVTEIKKILSDKNRKLEEEKIENMNVEPVFKSDELPKGTEESQVQSLDQKTAPTDIKTADNEIQSLEDFLVEELEQAAEKKAAQDTTEETASPITDEHKKERIPETPPTEKIVTSEPPPEPVEKPDDVVEPSPIDAGPSMDMERETPPEVTTPPIFEEEKAQYLAEEQMQPSPAQTPAEEPGPPPVDEPILPEEQPAADATTPTFEPVPPMEKSEPAEQFPETEAPTPPEPKAEPIEKPVTEEQITAPEPAPAAPESTEPEKQTTIEKPDTADKKEEPKKPKEEDFKSFQDWLSGLLK